MTNKKLLLIVSGLASVLVIILGNTNLTYDYCPQHAPCTDIIYDLVLNLLPVLYFFLFFLITYFMREDVYRAWFRFARVWIPLSILLIFIAPEYSSEFFYQIGSKAGVVFIMGTVLFIPISVGIIVWKYFVAPRPQHAPRTHQTPS